MVKFFSLLFLSFSFVSCGNAPDMPDFNTKTASVDLLSAKDEKIFFLLPMTGKVKDTKKFWSGDFWALNQGNINLRWNALFPTGFDLVSPGRELVLMLTREELMTLSPSEKFDIWLGRYDYPLKAEVYTHAWRDALPEVNISNGWALASINHNEPAPKELSNPDGIMIPFGSADIKALLSYYYAFIHSGVSSEQVGRLCPQGDCQNNLNPGSFHIALANSLGKRNEGLLIDIDNGKSVLNYPVHSFTSEMMGDIALNESEVVQGTRRVIRVKTKVLFVDKSELNTWEPVLLTPLQKYLPRVYVYDLFLDYQNTIIGGVWKSNDKPDFLWKMGPTKEFKGSLTGLGTLLND